MCLSFVKINNGGIEWLSWFCWPIQVIANRTWTITWRHNLIWAYVKRSYGILDMTWMSVSIETMDLLKISLLLSVNFTVCLIIPLVNYLNYHKRLVVFILNAPCCNIVAKSLVKHPWWRYFVSKVDDCACSIK